jgi:hypothetical protein
MTYTFPMLKQGTLEEVCHLFFNHPWFQVLWACEGTRVSQNSKGVFWQNNKNPATVHGFLNVQPELTYLPKRVLPASSKSVVARQWTTFHCEGTEFSGCAHRDAERSSNTKPSAVALRANCYGHCVAAVAVSLLHTVCMCSRSLL